MTEDDLNRRIVTIDGPAGAGKSSVARQVAGRLGFHYLDTGAMYRAVTWACDRATLLSGGPLRETAVENVLRVARLCFEPGGRVVVDGVDVTAELRQARINEWVSAVSALPSVRRRMVVLQRRAAKDAVRRGTGIVVDGRDIGSHVFPGARFRFYLDATLKERARRRRAQEDGGGSLEEWMARIRERDRQDSRRECAPLKVPEGARIIDSTEMTEEEVVSLIVEAVRA